MPSKKIANQLIRDHSNDLDQIPSPCRQRLAGFLHGAKCEMIMMVLLVLDVLCVVSEIAIEARHHARTI